MGWDATGIPVPGFEVPGWDRTGMSFQEFPGSGTGPGWLLEIRDGIERGQNFNKDSFNKDSFHEDNFKEITFIIMWMLIKITFIKFPDKGL